MEKSQTEKFLKSNLDFLKRFKVQDLLDIIKYLMGNFRLALMKSVIQSLNC